MGDCDVTLYADASFSPKTRVGGWGVWLKSTAGRIVRSGPCPPYVEDANDAELAAIFAGLHLLTKHWPDARSVLVRSDSQDALRRLVQRPVPPRVRAMASLCGKLDVLLAPLTLETAWVRGHQATGTRPGYVNDRVDALSRAARIAAERKGP